MALVDVRLTVRSSGPPGDVRRFLAEADRRIEEFQQSHCIPGFVASDYQQVYGVLSALAESAIAPGNSFCEWGSGFGVVTCLAAMIGFDAYGIEVEPELVAEAEKLATDFDVPAVFVCGSFIPPAAGASLGKDREFSWLTTRCDDIEAEWGLDAGDFDTVFVYPWPDEQQVIADLFDRITAPGAVIVTNQNDGTFRVRRKVAKRGRRNVHF